MILGTSSWQRTLFQASPSQVETMARPSNRHHHHANPLVAKLKLTPRVRLSYHFVV
jgi:hypothetical protein